MTPPLTKAYSYIRYSSKGQEGNDSVRRQLKLAQDYCLEYNLSLDTEYQDHGVSAFSGKNNHKDSALGSFLSQLEQGGIEKDSYLLIENLDRLSREDVDTALDKFRAITKAGITIVTLFDRRVYSINSKTRDTDLMLCVMAMARAHEESLIKSKRVQSAWVQRRKESLKGYTGGAIPFWLTLKDSTFILEPKATELIELIFTLSSEGYGSVKIASLLNDRGYKTRKGKAFEGGNIFYLLKNRAVLGEKQFHLKSKETDYKRVPIGEPVKDYYPSVITEDLFLLSQNSSKSRTVKTAGRRGKYFSNLFFGMLSCEDCKSNLRYLVKRNTATALDAYCTCPNFRAKTCKATPALYWHLVAFLTSIFTDGQYLKEWKVGGIGFGKPEQDEWQYLSDDEDRLELAIKMS